MTPQNKIMYSAKVNLSLNHQEMTPIDEGIDTIQGLQHLRDMEKNRVSQPMRSIDRLISQHIKTPLNEWEEEHKKVKNLFKNLKRPQNVVEFDIPEEE